MANLFYVDIPITVQVTDSDGLSATDQTTIEVLNVAPTATFANLSGTINEAESATLAFSDKMDPSAADVAAGFRYSYDCMDDGTFEDSAGQIVTRSDLNALPDHVGVFVIHWDDGSCIDETVDKVIRLKWPDEEDS